MSETDAQTVTFVRDTMLPAVPPPVRDRGAVKWLRENLFSGWLNSALTLAAFYVIYLILAGLVPWLMNSVWNAGSLSECRQIVAASAGEGATGACWAMLRERWHQFIFGLYPSDLYWRPTLAFALLFVALAPVLFTQVPRRMFWFTLAYPAIAYFLLWGGPIWTTLVGVFGFVLLAVVYRASVGAIGVSTATGAGILAAVLWWLFLAGPVATFLADAAPIGLRFVPSSEFGGFLLAITIGVTAIAFSLPLGILLALGRQSDMPVVKTICVGFIEFIRGVPLITLLFTASLLLGYFLPRGTTFDVILRVMILVTFFAAAYLAEVIRGGLAALPRGQFEAADALGLDYWRAQRLIVLPQALKIAIPGIVSTFIGLFKDTTLVSFVALLDPLRGVTNAVRADINWKGIYWEPYIFVGAIFFVICFGMSRYSMYLEQKLKTDHR
jgi:general L-amino acid transport system permease protein